MQKKNKNYFKISNIDNEKICGVYAINENDDMLSFLCYNEIRAIHKKQNLWKIDIEKIIEYEMEALALALNYYNLFERTDPQKLLKFDNKRQVYYHNISSYVRLTVMLHSDDFIFELECNNIEDWDFTPYK